MSIILSHITRALVAPLRALVKKVGHVAQHEPDPLIRRTVIILAIPLFLVAILVLLPCRLIGAAWDGIVDEWACLDVTSIPGDIAAAWRETEEERYNRIRREHQRPAAPQTVD